MSFIKKWRWLFLVSALACYPIGGGVLSMTAYHLCLAIFLIASEARSIEIGRALRIRMEEG